MEPLTAAGTVATIVGLICNFRNERGATAALDHQQFIEWLEYHRHEEIKNLITSTTGLQSEVEKLLHNDHALIIEKLDMINQMLAYFLSQVAEFRGLAHALNPKAEISDQANSILRQLVDSGSSYFNRIKRLGGSSLHLEKGGQISYSEPRFLDDDLEQLIRLDLLGRDYGNSGTEIHRITRNAVRLVNAVK